MVVSPKTLKSHLQRLEVVVQSVADDDRVLAADAGDSCLRMPSYGGRGSRGGRRATQGEGGEPGAEEGVAVKIRFRRDA